MLLHRFYLLTLSFLLVFVVARGADADSLKTIAANSSLPDSTRLQALNELASAYMHQHPDSLLFYATHYAEMAAELASGQDRANAYHLMGIAHFFKGELSDAMTMLNQSLEHRGNKGNLSKKAASLNVIGAVYMQQGNHAKAMDHYMKCLRLSEELDDKRGISGSHHNIGRIYVQQKDYKKALFHFQSSLEHKDPSDLNGVAAEYDVIASTHSDLENDSLAQQFFMKALQLRKQVGNPVGLAMSYSNLGQYYMQKSAMDTAMHYLQLSMQQNELANDMLGTIYSNLMLGQGYQQLKELDRSAQYAEAALRLARSVNDAKLSSEAANLLSSVYKELGKHAEALKMYELHIILRDSIQSEENQREVLRQEYAYQYEKEALTDSLEFAKKEAVLEERTEKQRLGLFAAGGGVLLLLALAFSIYSGKRKSDELLLNILPEKVAEELKEKGHSDAQLIDEVTVLFTDFKGFTALSEQVTPKELVKDLHECFSAFDHICEKYGIEKIKTIGDAYMAAGGLPSPHPTHAEDVAKAALEMAKVVEEGKAKKQAANEPFFEIRIGIHTGPVVAGIVGVKKFQYDIWGDTVNTASRMESAGEVGKVNISESTYEILKDDASFAFESRGKIQAKGKGEMEMYFVKRMV